MSVCTAEIRLMYRRSWSGSCELLSYPYPITAWQNVGERVECFPDICCHNEHLHSDGRADTHRRDDLRRNVCMWDHVTAVADVQVAGLAEELVEHEIGWLG